MAIKVLAVDDEADILRLVEFKLRREGFEVLTARDGQEAIDRALAERPDVMVIDVMMARKDGYAVVSEVKEHLGEQAPAMILLTALGQEADLERGRASGADDYMVKPFEPRELVARVNAVLLKRGSSTNI